jgi:hypothetical protein
LLLIVNLCSELVGETYEEMDLGSPNGGIGGRVSIATSGGDPVHRNSIFQKLDNNGYVTMEEINAKLQWAKQIRLRQSETMIQSGNFESFTPTNKYMMRHSDSIKLARNMKGRGSMTSSSSFSFTSSSSSSSLFGRPSQTKTLRRSFLNNLQSSSKHPPQQQDLSNRYSNSSNCQSNDDAITISDRMSYRDSEKNELRNSSSSIVENPIQNRTKRFLSKISKNHEDNEEEEEEEEKESREGGQARRSQEGIEMYETNYHNNNTSIHPAEPFFGIYHNDDNDA